MPSAPAVAGAVAPTGRAVITVAEGMAVAVTEAAAVLSCK